MEKQSKSWKRERESNTPFDLSLLILFQKDLHPLLQIPLKYMHLYPGLLIADFSWQKESIYYEEEAEGEIGSKDQTQ